MELTPKQQTTELVRGASRILVVTHTNPDGDALGSTLALAMVLKKLGKEVVAVIQDPIPETFGFLPGITDVLDRLNQTKDFIISLATTKATVEKLGYKSVPAKSRVDIIVTPGTGTFGPQDVSFSEGTFKFDLIFVLDSPDLDRLGTLYDENTDLFYQTPVVNIDHHPGNDYFGKVNWVDLTSTSTAEILVSLIESLGREKTLFDEEIATALLTGITTDTGSFQNSNTTPKSLTVAAQLVAAGARHGQIVRAIYKTKKLSTLKLWGRVLSNIQHEPQERFVWSSLRADEFSAVGALETEASGVIDELLKSAPAIEFALLLSERQTGLHGSMRAIEAGVNVAEIARLFNGGGHEQAAAFVLEGETLSTKQEEIVAKIKAFQQARIHPAGEVPAPSPTSESAQ